MLSLRWIFAWSAGLLVLLFLVATFLLQDNVFRFMMNPRVPYETYQPPQQADYADPASWILWPETIEPPQEDDQARAMGADIFYVHSTTYASNKHWNAPILDKTAREVLLKIALPNEAGPFQHLGAVYAPAYRQATQFAFFTQKHQGREARRTAYKDVAAAFSTYLDQADPNRPLILVGYGQGGLHVQGLLANFFQTNEPLRRRLVSAYIIDQSTPLDMFDTTFSATPPCRDGDDIRCVISWTSYAQGFEQEAWRARNRALVWDQADNFSAVRGRPLLCTNPITWRNGTHGAQENHAGAASATGPGYGQDPVIIEQAISATCDDGIVMVSKTKKKYLKRPKYFGGKWAPLPYNLFYEDIRLNAVARMPLLAKLLHAENQLAPPMEEAVEIGDSPINKVPG